MIPGGAFFCADCSRIFATTQQQPDKMESAREDIEITTGDAFIDVWRFEDIDLRSAVLKAQIRAVASGDVAATFTIVDLDTRTETLTRCNFIVPSSQTAGLIPGGQYVYDIQFTAAGEPQALVRGKVNVIQGVTT